ncbi:MAG TPA: hypothetical protein DCM28_22250 [Phycisphaerales bacterium]|nr:hypothetical protein [Phycisphaerales bacterium]HCD33782.1 hypothetical protein [Phycisphaerales bacterium]
MLGVMFMTGCWEDVSIDRHTFRSTPHLPATVVLMDTTNHEEFWKMDVPVCMRLRLDFSREPEVEGAVYNRNPASELTWTLMSDDTEKVIDRGQCFFDGCRPFLMKVRYRDSPETRDDGASIVRSAPGAKPAGMTQSMSAAPAAQSTQVAAAPAQAPAATQQVYQAYSSSGQTYSQPAAQQPQQYQEIIVRPEPQAYAN